MKVRHPGILFATALGSAFVVYRDIKHRAELLAAVLRGQDLAEIPIDDTLAAYAEPTSLPEPMLRSKVG